MTEEMTAIEERGCGTMAHDAVYVQWMLGSHGIPVSQTTVCPVHPVPEELGLSDVGMNILPVQGIYHIFDLVGRDHYPYKADFYEETRNMGVSRRWPTGTDISMLEKGMSKHLLLSRGGWYHDGEAERELSDMWMQRTCLRDFHETPLPMDWPHTCTQQWWYEHRQKDCKQVSDGTWWRTVGSTTYQVFPRSGPAPRMGLGIFMTLPLGSFLTTTPRGSADLSEKVEKYAETLEQAGFTVNTISLPDYL